MILEHFERLKEDVNYLKQDANSRIRHLEAALAIACNFERGLINAAMDKAIDTDFCGGYFPVKKEYEKYTGGLIYES